MQRVRSFVPLIPVVLGAALVQGSCSTDSDESATEEPVAVMYDGNPLLEEWATPFGVPPFDEIRNEHYLPAFREAMSAHATEIAAITANEGPATFDNTIVAMERAGQDLSRVSRVFYAVEGAHSNDDLREVARTVAPELSSHRDDIRFDPDLWKRVEAVWEGRSSAGLDPEQERLLEDTYESFVRSGAALDETSKARLREINSELAELSTRFSQNLLAETNDFELHIDDRADAGHIPGNLLVAAEAEAKKRGHESGLSFTLQRPSINPFLQYSPNRELRERIFLGYAMRGDNDNDSDNKAILSRMADLRVEKANLLGYGSYADYVLSDNMAETPERVYDLLDRIWEPAIAAAKADRDAFQAMMHADGVNGDFEAWDWRYYAEKVRKERYDLDEEALRPYFEVNAARDGVFLVANRLYGITFTELPDVPRWHPDQQVFEVKEADGSHIGILYMDFFIRDSKRGGAWMNSLRSQSRFDGEVTPIVTTNFNFPGPTGDTPALLSFGDVETLAHEMGHALHGLFSDVTYRSLSGTSVDRDFVELGSQIMENWMGEPEVLALYARHFRTGEPIPSALIEKLDAASKFDQGFATSEYLAASYLDMAWHTLTEPAGAEPRAFEAEEMERIGLIEEIIPRYRSPYFAHIFSGGYSAGYYAYIWAEVLDADAFQAFKETSLFDRETAGRFRREVLSQGGTRPGMELYRNFRGRDPSIEPLLERRGLD
ncbi:MAG: M3 family metallopeptidase [marine benthic group bacterium]|nr:M3 family metallopeptidase [Gemmatimonadota bacterium]